MRSYKRQRYSGSSICSEKKTTNARETARHTLTISGPQEELKLFIKKVRKKAAHKESEQKSAMRERKKKNMLSVLLVWSHKWNRSLLIMNRHALNHEIEALSTRLRVLVNLGEIQESSNEGQKWVGSARIRNERSA